MQWLFVVIAIGMSNKYYNEVTFTDGFVDSDWVLIECFLCTCRESGAGVTSNLDGLLSLFSLLFLSTSSSFSCASFCHLATICIRLSLPTCLSISFINSIRGTDPNKIIESKIKIVYISCYYYFTSFVWLILADLVYRPEEKFSVLCFLSKLFSVLCNSYCTKCI